MLVRHSILPEGSADACSLYDDGREVRKRRPLHTRPPSKVLGCRVVGRATAGKDDAMNNKLKATSDCSAAEGGRVGPGAVTREQAAAAAACRR